MATPEQVGTYSEAQDATAQLPLRDEKRDDVTDGQLVPRGAPSQGEQQTGEDITATETNATISEERKEEGGRESVETPDDGTAQPELSDVAVPLSDHQSRILDPETDMSTTNRDESEKDVGKAASSEGAEVPKTEDSVLSFSILPQNDESNTGDSTPAQDSASTPSTPRSTPAKPSVFKKTASIQKVTLNKDFLKSILPTTQSPSPGLSTTPRPAAAPTPKPTSSATKALKPMVRNRLSNMAASMQRQGSGGSTPKSGRGISPSFGRGGSGSEVWSWRRQPTAQKEYSEEELQRQGVHLTARLTTGGDDGNKWADMDDDWSDEDVMEEPKEMRPAAASQESLAQHENHVDDETMHIAPHVLESAALAQAPKKQEDHQHIIVTKNERFADVTFDRRDNRSPDHNIHGQRQIYNPKLGRFEAVEPAKEPERHGRRNIEIMQRGPPGRRGSSPGRRRESLTKGMVMMDEPRQGRASLVDNRGYSPTTQRRTSFAEQRDAPLPHHRRRDSFISTSGVSDADRSVSNASPGLDSQTTPDLLPVDLIALQEKQMAESRKRAMERRAKDEGERLAAAERARKKAAELAAQAEAAAVPPTEGTKSDASSVSPGPTKASPLPPKASPVPPRASPLAPSGPLFAAPAKPSPVPPLTKPQIATEELAPPTRTRRSDSGVWQANRDQEISKEDSVSSKDEKRSAWGAIGSSQKSTTTTKQQNGLFNNPNTLATLNSTIGGDIGRRGRNAPRAPRGPINPSNVPPPLQGWAAFAGNIETRRAHDNEKQSERSQEQDQVDREREANGPRPHSIVDKWKKIEIKDPENAGDVAGRTVVSVLKSGYLEDASGNVEVRDVTSPGVSSDLPPGAAPRLTSAKSPTISSAQALGMQTPTQPPPIGDKTPGSRDRSRFFPSPVSTVVDMSPRIVHPIQPQQSDKSLFPQSLFPSFDDMSKTSSASSTVTNLNPLPTTSLPFNAAAQSHQSPQRQHMPPFAQYGPPLPTSPGQSLAAAPHIGGLTPRSAFSHTVPVASPPVQPQYKAKLPSVEDFDTVLARLRESMQTAQEPANEDVTNYADPTAVDPQIQIRSDATPALSDTAPYLRISAISQHRDLEISTRDVDDEPTPRAPTVRVSLPKMLHTSTRDIEVPTDTKKAPTPTIKIPLELPSFTPSTSDLKTRLHAVDQSISSLPKAPFLQRAHPTPSHRHPHAFKIEFSGPLRPRGDVVPNLVKKDKRGLPYVNFEAKPEALILPAYGHDNEVFYALRDLPYEGSKPPSYRHSKFLGKSKDRGPQTPTHHRRGLRGDRGSIAGEGSSSSAASSIRGGGIPSRAAVEKK